MSGFARLLEAATKQAIPFSAVIELTRRCDYSCRHCYLPPPCSASELPLRRVLDLLEELATAGTLSLGLTGGEPLLYPGWELVVERARELHFAVHLLTNGSLVDDGVARRLAQAIVAVDVSVYGTTRDTFEAVTRSPGSLERTLRGVELLCAEGVQVTLKVPVMSLNAAEADAVSGYAERVGAKCNFFSQIVPRRDGDTTPIALRQTGRRHLQVPPESEPSTPTVSEGASIGDGLPCAAGARLAAIAHNGDVLPCLLLPFPAGNIRDQHFADIWQTSPVLARFRATRRSALRICGSCAHLSSCGRCPAQALHEDGDLLGPSRWACEQVGVAPGGTRAGS